MAVYYTYVLYRCSIHNSIVTIVYDNSYARDIIVDVNINVGD
jgi:hypothetical protein